MDTGRNLTEGVFSNPYFTPDVTYHESLRGVQRGGGYPEEKWELLKKHKSPLFVDYTNLYLLTEVYIVRLKSLKYAFFDDLL